MPPRTYAPRTAEAARLLGAQIRLARMRRRWTVAELAERIGVTEPTVRKVERGDPTVSLGVAFEAATTVGLPLFDADEERRGLETRRIGAELALLPKAVRRPAEIDDDF